MRHSTDHILTTHAGSLSRTRELIELNQKRSAGQMGEDASFSAGLSAAVKTVVDQQRAIGIDS